MRPSLASVLSRPYPGSLARRERDALCDLALEVGATAPTLCDGWSAKDLVVHLLLRERRPWTAVGSAAGSVLPALAGATDRAWDDLQERDLASLVTRLRSVPLPLAVVDPLVNGVEMFVHHEDLRRGQPGWAPRALAPRDERSLWVGAVATTGRLLVRPAGVPVVVESGERRAVLRRGEDPVVVSGPVSEVVMFLFGRAEVSGLELRGPEERVERLRSTPRGM